jgi:hypothetical protein
VKIRAASAFADAKRPTLPREGNGAFPEAVRLISRLDVQRQHIAAWRVEAIGLAGTTATRHAHLDAVKSVGLRPGNHDFTLSTIEAPDIAPRPARAAGV